MAKKACSACNGTGKCPHCGGSGGGLSYVCKVCRDSKKCPTCKGTGVAK